MGRRRLFVGIYLVDSIDGCSREPKTVSQLDISAQGLKREEKIEGNLAAGMSEWATVLEKVEGGFGWSCVLCHSAFFFFF